MLIDCVDGASEFFLRNAVRGCLAIPYLCHTKLRKVEVGEVGPDDLFWCPDDLFVCVWKTAGEVSAGFGYQGNVIIHQGF